MTLLLPTRCAATRRHGAFRTPAGSTRHRILIVPAAVLRGMNCSRGLMVFTCCPPGSLLFSQRRKNRLLRRFPASLGLSQTPREPCYTGALLFDAAGDPFVSCWSPRRRRLPETRRQGHVLSSPVPRSFACCVAAPMFDVHRLLIRLSNHEAGTDLPRPAGYPKSGNAALEPGQSGSDRATRLFLFESCSRNGPLSALDAHFRHPKRVSVRRFIAPGIPDDPSGRA